MQPIIHKDEITIGDIKMIIIKIGGAILEHFPQQLLEQMRQLSQTNKLVVVYGAGIEINQAIAKQRLETKRVDGLRVTSLAVLHLAKKLIETEVEPHLQAELVQAGIKVGHCTSAVVAQCLDETTYGLVGKISSVKIKQIDHFFKTKDVLLVGPIVSDGQGGYLNVNADDVAMALSVVLDAEQLNFVTDVAGVMDEQGQVIPKISKSDISLLAEKGVISNGMKVKLQSALKVWESKHIAINIGNSLKKEGTILI